MSSFYSAFLLSSGSCLADFNSYNDLSISFTRHSYRNLEEFFTFLSCKLRIAHLDGHSFSGINAAKEIVIVIVGTCRQSKSGECNGKYFIQFHYSSDFDGYQ